MFLRVCDVTMSQFIFLRGFVLKPTCRAEILWAAVGIPSLEHVRSYVLPRLPLLMFTKST